MTANWLKHLVVLLPADPKWLFCFGSFVVLDVACGFFIVLLRLACDHLYRKWLFIWMSLVMFLIVSYFVLSNFLTRCLG